MGLISFLRQLFKKKIKEEAIQSDLEAIQSDARALLNRSKALQSAEEIRRLPSLGLQKDSLELGLAAGYTGRALREIESSLNRIESQMVSKDWFTSQFEDKTPELINVFKKHEESEQKRFEALQKALISLKKTAESVPEPTRTELLSEIKTIESKLPLTSKMEKALEIIRESKEISYEELANRLGLNKVSGLRGLLSNMRKRTNIIERFKRGGKGWVRYVGDLNRSKALQSAEEDTLKSEPFKEE